MKAYRVEDPGDDECRVVVVHAETRSAAKSLGLAELSEFGCPEWIDLRVTREPGFDGIYGDELIRAQLAAGWYMECGDCREHVRSEVEDEAYDEGHLSAPYILRDGVVYCSTKCCLKQLRRERQRSIDKREAIERATLAFPGVPVLDAYKNQYGVVATLQRPENQWPTIEHIPPEEP
jgi:hypothetical protein